MHRVSPIINSQRQPNLEKSEYGRPALKPCETLEKISQVLQRPHKENSKEKLIHNYFVSQKANHS